MHLYDVILCVKEMMEEDRDHIIYDVICQETDLPLAMNCHVKGTEHGLTLPFNNTQN